MVGRFWRYRGQANPGNWEELAPGSLETDGAQLATCHCSAISIEERRDAEEKEGGRGHRPCEELESWFGCPHVDIAVAEVVRRRLVSNKLGTRAAKTAAGSSERGPSSKRTAVGETIDGFGERKVRRGIPAQSPAKDTLSGVRGRVRTKTQGDARVSLSGWSIAKSGEPVAGPGL